MLLKIVCKCTNWARTKIILQVKKVKTNNVENSYLSLCVRKVNSVRRQYRERYMLKTFHLSKRI